MPEDPAYVAAMSKPGFKVLHIQDIDFHSSCLTFVECLTIIRDWSRAHPRHVPILITMNTNDEKTRAPGGVGCRAMWQWTHSMGSAAVKGSAPVSIS